MKIDLWNIVYYKTPRGKNPVQEFIDSLEAAAIGKIIRTLDLLEEFNTKLTYPRVEKVGDLWMIRILGADNIRIFYVAIRNKTFLLLHGYVKKKQKIDIKEKKIAKERLKEYNSRNQ